MSKANSSSNLAPEWSHKIDVDDIEDQPLKITITASAEDRKNLARRLDVQEIKALEADLTLIREQSGHVIYVTGSLEAALVQLCVVTLQPLESSVQERIEAWYSDHEQAVSLARQRRERESATGHAEFPILEESEDPEPVINGQIDLGELVTQYLSLAVDPFPHAEGAALENIKNTGRAAVAGKRPNPFAALKDWKQEREKSAEKQQKTEAGDKK